MKMKKILTLAVCTALSVTALSGCGSTQTAQETSSDAAYKVGLCQLVQHEALDAATQGFSDKLTELMGDGAVEFDLQNAAGDSATCSTIVNQFVSSNYDLIFANATPALQAAASATGDIPVVGTSVTDYATALDITDWTGKTGVNITGTSDLAPLEDQAKMFSELLPDAKTIGMLYCSSEANSKFQVDAVKAELEKLGYTTVEFPFADSNDISTVVNGAVSKCDALYIPTDNTAAANTELIANIVEPAKIPVITGEEGICSGCGIATLSISYYSLGEVTAQMAYDILINGKNPADMDIQYATDLTKKYDKARCEALGITVPADYEEIAK